MDKFGFLTIYLAGSAALGFSLAFFRLLYKNRRFAKRIYQRLHVLNERIATDESRLAIVEREALDYMLSVGTEGGKSLVEMRNTLNKAKHLAQEVESLAVSHDFLALEEASRLLHYDYSRCREMHGKPASSVFPRADWERRFEDIIQSAGEKIQNASMNSKAIHLPKLRTEKSTLGNLFAAGIRSLTQEVRANREPVRVVLKKNDTFHR